MTRPIENQNLTCPACEAIRSCRFLERKDLFEIMECSYCKLSFSNPMKAADEHYYESFSEYADKWEFGFLSQQLKKNGFQGTLLDIGCGDGRFLAMLPSSYKAWGIDFNEKAVATAKNQRGLNNVFWGGLDNLGEKFSEKKLNLITVFHVLEHTENPGRFLESLKSLLHADGRLIISVPNPNRWTLITGHESWDYPPHHLTRWTLKSLSAILESHHFKIDSVKPEPVLSWAQVKSGADDLVWKFIIRYFSFGLSRHLTQNSNSPSTPGRPEVTAAKYQKLADLKVKAANFFACLIALLFFPFLLLWRAQGKTLLIYTRLNHETKS